jgi:hypothetical protein
MIEYRAYAIGSDGHIAKAIPLVCDGDNQAIEQAKKALQGHTIEVWSGNRFVTRIDLES